MLSSSASVFRHDVCDFDFCTYLVSVSRGTSLPCHLFKSVMGHESILIANCRHTFRDPHPTQNVVRITTQGGTLRRAVYSASPWCTGLDYGASYGCASDDPALIVTRATEAAKFGEGASGWSGYSLLTNNCETFAYWCSTGR